MSTDKIVKQADEIAAGLPDDVHPDLSSIVATYKARRDDDRAVVVRAHARAVVAHAAAHDVKPVKKTAAKKAAASNGG